MKRTRARLRRMLVAVPLALTVVAIGTGTADAHSGSHWWPNNGCTAAPDHFFNHACVHHDGCYAYHWADRGTCDQWFLNDMMATCRSLPFDMVGGCAATAFVYYGVVRAAGGYFYDNPEVATRISVPVA